MDFKSLLSLAKDNQSYNIKKHERDKMLRAKKGRDQVSDDAVKAYLAKKQLEARAKRDAENKAKQERILARVEGKKTNDKKGNQSVTTNGVKSHLQKQRNELPKATQTKEKPKEVRQGSTKPIPKISKSNNATSSNKATEKSHVEQKTKAADKNESIRRKEDVDRRHHKDGLKMESKDRKPISKAGSSSKIADKKPGLSFMELMNMAKQQANKPVSLQKPVIPKPNVKKKQEVGTAKDFNYERYEFEKSLGKRKAKDNKMMSEKRQLDMRQPEERKSAVRSRSPVREAKSAGTNSNIRQAKGGPERPRGKPDKCVLVTKTLSTYSSGSRDSDYGRPGFKRPMPPVPSEAKRPRMNGGRNRLRDIDIELERERRELERKRKMFENKYGGASAAEDEYDYYDDYDDDEDEDDMDDFIDDSEAGPDVSREIRRITGYDRRRFFDDDDDDLDSMEASYSQIQQEEARSSRIGKLEDDIERLRELKEMQREKKKGGR